MPPEKPSNLVRRDNTGAGAAGARAPAKPEVLLPTYPKYAMPKGPYVSDPMGAHIYRAGWNCQVQNGVTNLTPPIARFKTESSVRTPNFKQLKKRDLPWNPYNLVKEIKTYSTGEWNGYLRGYPCSELYSGYIYNRVPNSGKENWPAFTESTKKQAEAKALARVKSMKINLAQAFGERQQTARLIQTSVNRFLTAAIAVKNGRVKHAANVLGLTKEKRELYNQGKRPKRRRQQTFPEAVGRQRDNLADWWLELQYGWKPLLSDIYGAAEHIAYSYYAQRPLRATARVSDVQRRIQVPKGILAGPYSQNEQFGEFCDSIFESRSTVILEFTEDATWCDAMSRTGLTNPALLAWELLPYSFVVDWFVPLGAYLSAMDAGSGLNFKRGMCYTVTKQLDVTNWRKVKSDAPLNGYTTTLSGNQATRRRETKVRTIYGSFPFPKFPDLQPKVGVEKALTSLSLLNQVFNRGKTSAR